MTSVELRNADAEAIREHGRRAYPEEACGFLVGPAQEEGPVRRVLRVVAARNRAPGERARRFVIPADELRVLERELDGTPEAVVGFYHSHPDHAPRPSPFDEEHAWPWYTYLVLAVPRAGPLALGAFELDPEARRFREVDLHFEEPSARLPAVVRAPVSTEEEALWQRS